MRWDFDTAEPTWFWVEGRLQIPEESVCARALESCGKYRLPGPPVVLILRSGQENLYSEADLSVSERQGFIIHQTRAKQSATCPRTKSVFRQA